MEGIYVETDEAIQIIISVVAISFAFTIVFAGLGGLISYPGSFFVFMVLSLVTVGSGFILHEMAHKIVAIYYGAQARFQMWVQGLVFMLIISLLGVLFAAPGAVYIYSNNINRRQNGIISFIGPLVNVALVAFFLGLSVVAPIMLYFPFPTLTGNGPVNAWYFGAQLNLILALFNMIPAFPIDGSKVFRWSKALWGTATLALLAVGVVLLGWGIVLGWLFLLVLALAFSKLLFGGYREGR
jgi:Zn-dependent protease